MANKVYVGDVAVTLRVPTGLDLTTQTVMALKIKKPDGSSVSWTATVYGVATGGVLQYTTIAGDLSLAGLYQLQAYVELSGGGKYYGETASFTVYELNT